jgi:hypothetical protein
MKEADLEGINQGDSMVKYDQWSYLNMVGVVEVVFTALHEGIQICYVDISSMGSLAFVSLTYMV